MVVHPEDKGTLVRPRCQDWLTTDLCAHELHKESTVGSWIAVIAGVTC
jgi:hypothetical protein